MTVKPWREVAQPHRDVLEGTFRQSEFAADITQVHSGTAAPEYQDAEKFFSRTFITEGMRLLLTNVAQRLSGQGGDPVIQLQTAFGGGKTHTLLAVFHLASRACPTERLMGIPTLLDEAEIYDLPVARVAIIDGIQLSPSQPRKQSGAKVNTLWGELAWQLAQAEGYSLIAEADRDGTSPGKQKLVELLKLAAPCVVLIDELVAYIRQLEHGKTYAGGTYESNITFIQALTEAVKSVPNAILLASLPESEVELGGGGGQMTLAALEKFFGRVESVWKPVAAEEAFEIVRRRLFDNIGDPSDVHATAMAFVELYKKQPTKFPTDAQAARYADRIQQSYPIHPEVFDRLYEDWSTLDKFQRTRGVLQYMAIVIHRLWNTGDKDPLILPGSLPLDDANVRNKSIHYLPTGWEPVIEREIDGPNSETLEIDGRDTRFGSIQAARRVARTIFLGSAPSNSGQAVRGIRLERILLGAALPSQSVGVLEDVLKRLRDSLHYLYGEQDSYWFDTRPNLRREMESRKSNLKDGDEIQQLLRDRVGRTFSRNHFFAGIHVFTPSGDVPDEYGLGPRLVVLPPSAGYRRQDEDQAIAAAQEVLEKRGDVPRHKQNRLIFLLPDADAVPRLRDAARTYLAWKSIVEDVDARRMNLDVYQSDQAKRAMEGADETLKQLVRETYRWLMAPSQSMQSGKLVTHWECVGVSSTATNLIEAIQTKLVEEDWIVEAWSPVHLKRVLEQWYLKDGVESVPALKVWQDTCHYLYLPRLLSSDILAQTIASGVESRDFFGFANEKTEEGYRGFAFGRTALISLDSECVLIQVDAAAKHQAVLDTEAAAAAAQTARPSPETGPSAPPSSTTDVSTALPHQEGTPAVEKPSEQPTTFYGAIKLDPVMAAMDFSKVVEEVVQHFSAQVGVNVEITVEINATSPEGFAQHVQRTVRENCGVLQFTSMEFD